MYSFSQLKFNLLLLAFIVVASCLSLLLLTQARLRAPLFPVEKAAFPWHVEQGSDKLSGGQSSIEWLENQRELAYRFRLDPDFEFAYASAAMVFGKSVKLEGFVDWRAYSTVTFRVSCSPRNVLSIVLYTYDPVVTSSADFSSLRPSLQSFTCDNNAREIEISLDHLETPDWWLLQKKLDLSNKHYNLQQVYSFTVVNSGQSPADKLSEVRLTEVTLAGWNRFYLVWAGMLLIVAFALAGFIGYRWHTSRLVSGIKQSFESPEEPPVSALNASKVIQPVSAEPVSIVSKRDRDKQAILNYLAKEYTNTALNLDMLVSSLGLNRTKVNDILREHQGLTFSGYINKLRLTEAARLLREKDVRVAEIAYRVGYSNASYFNRVFKKEYGCTPGAFKSNANIQSHENG